MPRLSAHRVASMCTIRPAEPKDLDALTDMGAQFFAYSTFAKVVQFDRDAARAAIARYAAPGTMLTDPDSVVLVAEVEGEVVGGLVGFIGPMWFNPAARVATELAWWVAEEHRGGTAAIRLYRAFEAWADKQDADVIVMSDLVIEGETPAARLFEKLGYATVERAHIKQRGK
jgi:RimJ/RimL family protein N-acetyltransferase